MMTGEENKTRNLRGAAAWISSGLQIEEQRWGKVVILGTPLGSLTDLSSLGVAAKARSQGIHHSLSNKLALEQMRSKLLDDIELFNNEATKYIPASTMTAALALQPKMLSPGREWDSLEETLDTPSETIEDQAGKSHAADELRGKVILPERITIPLPSNLGQRLLHDTALIELVAREAKLREGQMNDALHGIRAAVGYKSFLYRHSVRKATTHRRKLRSFDEVHQANDAVQAHARIYSAARQALTRLSEPGSLRPGGDPRLKALLKKYKVLEKADLKANTALIEHDVRGLHNTHLAWFWSLDVAGDSKGQAWLNDSAHFHFLMTLSTALLNDCDIHQCTVWSGYVPMLERHDGRRS